MPVTRAATAHGSGSGVLRGVTFSGDRQVSALPRELMWTLPISLSTLRRGLDQLPPPQRLTQPPPRLTARELRQEAESPPERPGDQTHSPLLLPLGSPGPLPPCSLRKRASCFFQHRMLGQATGFLLSQRALSGHRGGCLRL